MSNENQTIHEFDLNIIYDYFQNTERQGPGSPEITLKALSFIDGLTAESKIADIGCGTGGQTMVLAQNTASEIIGVDLFPEFIQQFNQNAQNLNLQERVKGVTGDMKDLPFKEGELDLIWSEGAIYNIGFERGLSKWRKFLKTGGYIAVTENTWFTQERPTEIEDFWQEAYPEIDTISSKVAQMEKAGYLPIATFVVPESCWTDYYEVQHPQMQESLLEKYKGNKSAEEFIAYQQYEAELYRKYKGYYGYVFYIGKRIR
ncbi:class I SAM-dependent methyltransferase [Methanobacterium subterraneum]|uniref:Class I SAM-dependent methyltransferase n=1 Tax=Methanobacterium subterraneum TaxID=59277 RepID=A0A7K4DLZ7_9EURY|nr:class I SAM-dependent methyltransferase [Methanobacterium subterraneum]NMO09076.1 class I SAM-dependent methyltransferase [Methanobacterium subterraneum]